MQATLSIKVASWSFALLQSFRRPRMTTDRFFPVAEQYPSRTDTSDGSTSTRISVTDISSSFLRCEVISERLHRIDAGVWRYPLIDLGDR